VSLTGQGRRLRRLEQKHKKKHDPWLEAVYAMAREQKAALALAEVAQILAGTEKIKAARFVASSIDSTTEAEAHAAPVPPRRHRPVWSDTVRPGRDDFLTWEEAMQVPWLDGGVEAHQQ
jgi:hypothetical protein